MPDDRATLEPLIELTRLLVDESELEPALRAVTDVALAMLPADHASIRVFDESRTELLCGARSGAGVEYAPIHFQRGEGVIGWVAETGQATHIGAAPEHPHFKQGGTQGFVVQSLVASPLWSSGQVIGVLAATAPEEKAFDEYDQTLITLLGNCAVSTIERARLERLAMTDPRTLAYNRRYLLPRIQEEISRALRYDSSLTVLVIQLDHLANVRKRYGPAGEDRSLKGFAERVRCNVRHPDVLIRRGVDEFFLVMPHTGAVGALSAAGRIIDTLAAEEVRMDDGGVIHLTAALGIAEWDGHEGVEDFEARAERALADAREQGSNRIAVAPSERPPDED